MITQNEVYDMAMKTALHIMATPRAGDVVTKLERLILTPTSAACTTPPTR
jgi:hypothetical protein